MPTINFPIKNFDKPTLKQLSEDMVAALAPLMEKYGLEASGRGCTFSAVAATMKIEVRLPETSEAARDTFNSYCAMYDLKPEHFQKDIVVQGKNYKILGFEPSRPKFPIKVRDLKTGKVMLLTTLAVKWALRPSQQT